MAENQKPKKKKKTKEQDVASQGKQGVFWTALFQSIESVLRFASSIILARVLFPEDFGLMGLASIVIQLARRLTNFGFSTVLVQLKEIKREHYDTVFIMNFTLMAGLAALLFFGAPYYGQFFESENFLDSSELQLIIMWLSFDFLIKGLSSVPQAILKRQMKFKELGFAHTVGKFVSLGSTVAFALLGFGVWSLVYGTLLGSFTIKLQVIFYARWLPTFRFRWWAFKDSFSFGLWLYVGAYISYGINKVDYFIIGKFLGPAMLGFYERAFDLMSLPRKRIVRKVNSVFFATYSRLQDDNPRLVRGLLQVTRYLSIISYPFMIWMFFAAPALITNLYGAKWLPTVLPLQIMCISGILDSFTLIFQPLLKAKGWVGNKARRDLLYLVILAGSVYALLPWGIVGVAGGVAVASIIRLGIMLQLTVKRLPMTVLQFFGAMRSAIVYGAIQASVIYGAQILSRPYFTDTSIPMFILVSVLSAITFFGAHMIIRFQDLEEIFQDFFKELRKFARKLPMVKKLGILQPAKK